jgi:hypothetical protein
MHLGGLGICLLVGLVYFLWLFAEGANSHLRKECMERQGIFVKSWLPPASRCVTVDDVIRALREKRL